MLVGDLAQALLMKIVLSLLVVVLGSFVMMAWQHCVVRFGGRIAGVCGGCEKVHAVAAVAIDGRVDSY